MISFNIDSFGGKLRVNFGQDISAGTAFTMTIKPEKGQMQELTPTLGTSDADVGDGTYLANNYVEYTITEDLFDVAGIWRKKAVATVGGVDIGTPYSFFRVTE
jgi:hypothetical protein